jgi:Fe-S cluster assembly protein SufD
VSQVKKTSSSGVIDSYRRQFLAHTERWNGREPSWLSLLRREAFERFLDRGFPTTNDEDWRFTSVAPLASTEFSLVRGAVEGAELSSPLGAQWDRYELVFVNGHFAPEHSGVGSLPEGVILENLAAALESHPDELEAVLTLDPSEGATVFSDLNSAFLGDGAFVLLSEGVALEKPIHIVHVSAPASHGRPIVSHPHHVILAERGARMVLVESYFGDGGSASFTNAAAEIVAADGANVDHYRIQAESDTTFHVGSQRLLQARGAVLQDHSLSLGGRIARLDIHSLLDGEGADLTLNGLYVVKGTQHVDHHTVIDHRKPHGTSRELYKGVLDGAASGVFNGRIIVRPGAQKTNAQQTNKNLLLSGEALVNTNPQLEIEADDVKCAHGATIGQLDREALFYLRSRGIGPEEAAGILTRGFIADLSERIRVGAVREAVRRHVFAEAA